MEKDMMISFKNPAKSVTKTGKEFYKLYLDAEQVASLAAMLVEKGTENGVRFDLYFADKINSQTGHPFMSAFAFVKPKSAGPVGQAYNGPRKAVPTQSPDDIKAKIAATRAALEAKRI